MRIFLVGGDYVEAFKKNVSEGNNFVTVKEGSIFSEGKVDRGNKPLGVEMFTSFIPYARINYMEEYLVDETEPGSKPQPAAPKIKMWKLGKEEIIQEG